MTSNLVIDSHSYDNFIQRDFIMEHGIWFLPKKPDAKRILIHAINHVGLGHINRSIAVAQWLRARNPNIQFLFLIEGGEDFIEPTGFPWVLVPGQPSESGHCEQITRKVLEVFRPDLAIHETLLREAIHRPVREAAARQVIMGSIGDVLRGQLRQNLSMMNEVDLLLILQQKEEVMPSDQALIAQFRGKTVYAGPLVRKKNHCSSIDLRQKLGLTAAQRVVLATFGGGGWETATQLLKSLLAAKERILVQHPQTRLIVITGPHFSGKLPENDRFVCYASRFEPLLADYLNIASAVVCMAGYSTVNEIAASGIPAICVPAPEADDQVGSGSMAEYAQSFPNIVVSDTETEALANHIAHALTQERDLSAVQEFWRKAEIASQKIVDEITCLL